MSMFSVSYLQRTQYLRMRINKLTLLKFNLINLEIYKPNRYAYYKIRVSYPSGSVCFSIFT